MIVGNRHDEDFISIISSGQFIYSGLDLIGGAYDMATIIGVMMTIRPMADGIKNAVPKPVRPMPVTSPQ